MEAPAPVQTLAAYDMPSYEPLRARGLEAQTLYNFGVRRDAQRPGPTHFAYPVYDEQLQVVAWRHKISGGPHKYRWATEYAPARADALYNVRALASGQTIFVVAGEPDVWLMDQCSLRSVCFLAGEGCVRPEGVTRIALSEPKRVIVVYDNDRAGHEGMIKAIRALRKAGVATLGLILPETLPPKADITDLYTQCGHDRAHFVATLMALPRLIKLPPENAVCSPRSPEPTPRPAASGALSSPIARFKATYRLEDLVAEQVALRPYAGGTFLRGCCPFHDDKNPSFYVNRQKETFGCWGCGAHGDAWDFMELWLQRQGRPA
jgi:hypothetical protein